LRALWFSFDTVSRRIQKYERWLNPVGGQFYFHFLKKLLFGRRLVFNSLMAQTDMPTNVLFKVNRPQVISQIIDGEVVVINLHTGSYYSLTGAAATIWDAVERGENSAQIPGTLSAHFTDCDAGVENIVEIFLNELRGESLIVPAAPDDATPTNPALDSAPGKGEKFVRPALKKFTDMQELLLLDPIHEVDATGWPLAKSEPNDDAGK
jgi:hypothetical protein